MTAFELLVTGLTCLTLGVTGGLAFALHQLRQANRDRERWARMPGAVTTEPSDDMASEVFDWQAYDGWSVKA